MEYTKDNPLRCFFAFEGYNSQGMALNRIKEIVSDFDWVCVGRSEIDKYAIQSCNAVFPESADKNFGDISKIDWAQVPDFDMFTYSFPCQAISAAGKQRGLEENSGTTSSLLWECRNAIAAKKPRYLLMENVKALTQKKFMPYFQKWQAELESYGYKNFWQVMNAKDYGVPQNRERVFMVSILDDDAEYHFPKKMPLEATLKDYLDNNGSPVDEKYYIKDDRVQELLDSLTNKEDLV